MSAIRKFDSEVQMLVNRGTERQKAIRLVARRDPALHRAYLVETNQGKDAKTLAAVASGSPSIHPAVRKAGCAADSPQPVGQATRPIPPTPAPAPTSAVDPPAPVQVPRSSQYLHLSEEEKQSRIEDLIRDYNSRGIAGYRLTELWAVEHPDLDLDSRTLGRPVRH
ncbi:MAG: hypothetical protein ACYC6N_06565 [Pirellulaceae bacterium]